MNQKQLERKVRYWQKILKLDHWDISCELVHPSDIDYKHGMCDVQASYLKAFIRIHNPKYAKNPERDNPIDRIIIHELLHCHISMVIPREETHEPSEEERVVTLLEKAFYDLHQEIYE